MFFIFQMTATLVGAVDLHIYTQIEWEKSTNSLKVVVAKAEKTKDKAEKKPSRASLLFWRVRRRH